MAEVERMETVEKVESMETIGSEEGAQEEEENSEGYEDTENSQGSETVEGEEIEIKMPIPKANIDVLSRPDGSAYYTQGKTTVVAGVYGPIECRANKQSIEKAHIEMHYRPKSGLPNVGDRLYETLLRNTCESALLGALYPRTSVVIVVQEMEHGHECELIAASVNAACMAMLDSAIDMQYIVGAVPSCMDYEGNLTMNIDSKNLHEVKATFLFVFSNVCGSIVASHTTGTFTPREYELALGISRVNCVCVFNSYVRALELKNNYQQDDEGEEEESTAEATGNDEQNVEEAQD